MIADLFDQNSLQSTKMQLNPMRGLAIQERISDQEQQVKGATRNYHSSKGRGRSENHPSLLDSCLCDPYTM